MKFGFIIDNRKCIGCHACTTACKSEHQVPIGVNRTWVKYIEKGVFPDSRRVFSVMRCNHCTDAPCVEICPVEALYTRPDGIVDFDNRRCIGCKSCTQACPYNAIYIDPETKTAAKCNYCAHRVDVGLEPACVNVCPVGAIVSGDMDNPETNISKLLSRQTVTVRKAEKGTSPNLFYINGDQASLDPGATATNDDNLWSAQTLGVGHYAKEAEKLAFSNPDVISLLKRADTTDGSTTSLVDVIKGKARRAYDAPQKGILWGWEVFGYVLTKAISAGGFLVPFIAFAFGFAEVDIATTWWSLALGLVFLSLTGLLLVMDLDQPTRFLNVLLRPQWKSWLTKGGYAITVFGALLTAIGAATYFEWTALISPLMYVTAAFAVLVAIYTAFLFAQAKGHDFWQSPTLIIHMFIHSLMAGAAAFGILTLISEGGANWMPFLKMVLTGGILVNLATILMEITITHPTEDAKRTVHMITGGRYKNLFWGGVMFFGNILPLILMNVLPTSAMILAVIGVIVIIGIYWTNKIWIEAPQRLPNS